ncbi:MAG TPA: sensor histidine kinase [Anaerolineaceae bacterium]
MKLGSSTLRTGRGVDLAFAVVVLAAYFSTFSSFKQGTLGAILGLIFLGTLYISIGTYGYGYCARSGSLTQKSLYFLVQIFIGSIIVYITQGNGFSAMVLIPLASHSVFLLPQRHEYFFNMLILCSYSLVLYLISGGISKIITDLPVFLAGQIFIIVFTQMAVNEERARSQVENLVSNLEQANHRLRMYAAQIEELATTKERNRLAREIHDGLGHHLTTIHINIQAAIALVDHDPHRAVEILRKAQSQTQLALEDVRSSVATLRSPVEATMPVSAQIPRLLQTCEPFGIKGNFSLEGEERELNPQTNLILYRIIQEGINNACKHSKAKNLWIDLDFRQNQTVTLGIRDDGKGVEKIDGGFGIIGLKERVALLNGQLNISTSEGHGFEIIVKIPG